MTPEKYERLKQVINDLLPAREWLREKMLAAPEGTTALCINFKTPETIYISRRAAIGAETIIDGEVRIRGTTIIGQNCIIENAHLTNARLGDYVFIGPFAQISESEIGEGTDIPHHSYIGNATIGRYCNIGDAVTTSNFDGVSKHQTIIEDGCFIGTQMKIVPPVVIGRESFVAARELKKDIPPHSFVVQGVKLKIKNIDPNGKIAGAEGFIDAEGFLTEIIKPNRSFQLMPGRWLFTKKPVAPELMCAFREKLQTLVPAEKIWGFYKNPHPAVGEQSPLEAIKFNGEEAVEKLIAWLGRIA